MQIGNIYQGYEAYGGSGHCLGLFKVVKLGKKFASLRPIACVQIEEPQVQSTPADYHMHGKRKAELPLRETERQVTLVAYIHHNVKEDEAIVPNGGAMCTKTYTRIKPDDNGDYVYTTHATHYW